MNREQAIDLLDKLRRRTEARGATPAEAAQAAELAERIIRRYGLDGSEQPASEQSREMLERRWPPWASVLAMAIERRFDVVGRYQRGGGEPCRIIFSGPEHRCRLACWLFVALAKDIRQESDREARQRGKSGPDLVRWRNDFRLTAAWELFDRLNVKVQPKLAAAPGGESNHAPPAKRKSRRSKVRRLTTEQMDAMLAGQKCGRSLPIDTNVLGDRDAREPAALLAAPAGSGSTQPTLF